MTNEPIIHSHITDGLSKNHSLAYEEVFCKKCNQMLHAPNNECMCTWFETDLGNFCSKCFIISEYMT